MVQKPLSALSDRIDATDIHRSLPASETKIVDSYIMIRRVSNISRNDAY